MKVSTPATAWMRTADSLVTSLGFTFADGDHRRRRYVSGGFMVWVIRDKDDESLVWVQAWIPDIFRAVKCHLASEQEEAKQFIKNFMEKRA